MPQITKTETKNAGYSCDMCGVLISDGQHDGAGDMNWWGVNVNISPLTEEVVTIKRIWDGYKVQFSSKYTPGKTWGVCYKCADRVREFIKAGSVTCTHVTQAVEKVQEKPKNTTSTEG